MALTAATPADHSAAEFGLTLSSEYQAEGMTPDEIRTRVADDAESAGLDAVSVQVASNVASIAARRATGRY